MALSSAAFASFPDSREETVLGSIPLPSYVIALVEPDDNISRRYAFKVTDLLSRPLLSFSMYTSDTPSLCSAITAASAYLD